MTAFSRRLGSSLPRRCCCCCCRRRRRCRCRFRQRRNRRCRWPLSPSRRGRLASSSSTRSRSWGTCRLPLRPLLLLLESARRGAPPLSPSRCAADAGAAAAAEAPQQGPPHPLRLRYLRPQPPHLRREPARLLAGPRRGLGGQPLSLGGPRGVGPQRGGALLERGGGGLTRREPRAEALVLLLQGGLAQGEGAGGEPEGEL